jgi:hypothetical protein
MNADCRPNEEGSTPARLFGLDLLVVEDDGNADNCMLCVLLDWRNQYRKVLKRYLCEKPDGDCFRHFESADLAKDELQKKEQD